MTIPTWPASLQQYFLQDGFSYGFGEGRQKTPMDTGPGKTRRRFTAVGQPVSAAIVVTAKGVLTLRDFWKDDLLGGSLPFWIKNQIHQNQLVDEAGNPMPPGTDIGAPWLVMFGDPPVFTPWGMDYRAAFTLTVMP